MRVAVPVLVLAMICAGCGTITVPDAADEFKTSTGEFSKGLKSIGGNLKAANNAEAHALALQSYAPNEPIFYSTACAGAADQAQRAFNQTAVGVYDGAKADAAYTQFASLPLCDLTKSFDTPATVDPVVRPDQKSTIDGSGSFGEKTLNGTADKLDAYVKSLIDVITNKTGAKADTARNDAVGAFAALAQAIGADNGSAYGGVIQQAIASAQASARNKRVGEMLATFDSQMPTAMERIGYAGRVSNAQAIVARANAAAALAKRANVLMAQAAPGTSQLQTYAVVEPELTVQNDALRSLRGADPMVAAQAFAAAHRKLIEAYRAPKADQAAGAAAAKAFSDAAQKLSDALSKD